MVYSGAWGKLIPEKKSKISWQCPFKIKYTKSRLFMQKGQLQMLKISVGIWEQQKCLLLLSRNENANYYNSY